MAVEKRFVKYLQNSAVKIGDSGDGRRIQENRCTMRAKTETKMMTNGRVQADTSEKTIKNGTSKDGGGERKIGVRKGGQVRGMSDGSRSEGAEEEKIGDVGRREEEERGQRWKDD